METAGGCWLARICHCDGITFHLAPVPSQRSGADSPVIKVTDILNWLDRDQVERLRELTRSTASKRAIPS